MAGKRPKTWKMRTQRKKMRRKERLASPRRTSPLLTALTQKCFVPTTDSSLLAVDSFFTVTMLL